MSKKNTKILFAEDDPNLGFLLTEYLEMEGFAVTHCKDGEEAWQKAQSQTFDLCVLDVMMPKMDGFTLAEHLIDQNPDTPILFLTAKSLKEDRIRGFQIGGDDYVLKPFDEEELVCRIEAILKRSKKATETLSEDLIIGKYLFHAETQTLKLEQSERRLTQRECEVLKLLVQNKNKILKREDALIAIWGANDYFYGRSFDVFITKLRKYLSEDPSLKIENIHGVGFMLTDKETFE